MEKRVKHLKRSLLAEVLGWIGAASILFSYALASFGIINSNTVIYNLLFFAGSAGLALVTYRHRAFQSFAVNLIFVLLALIAIYRLIMLK